MHRIVRHFWWVCAVLAATLACAAPASAQAGLTGTPIAVCVAPVTPGLTATRALTDPRPFDCTRPQAEFGPGDFWVRSIDLPTTLPEGPPLGVRTASLWQRAVTLYALYADGTVIRRTADDRGLARKIQLGAIVEQRIMHPRGLRPIRLVWHVEGAANLRGIVVGARIATPSQSASSNVAMGAIYAAFAGFALALMAHNLAMWRALRQRFQLHYVAMLAMLMLYALSSSGALAWFGANVSNTDRLRVNYLSLALAATAVIGFARHFFEERIFAGWLGRAADAVRFVLVGCGILFAVAAPWQIFWLDRLYAGAFLGTALIAVPMLWRAWRLRSDYRWLFGLAWAAPILLAACRVAHNFGVGAWSFWLDNSTLLAMTGEALVSSLAIAYRVRIVARERDEARAQEIAARLLADVDPLTGLLNRRAFLAQAIGRTENQRLLILDIDHFKRVNETIGHDGGDEVLRRFARVLRNTTPAGALTARLGGEEFALLVPVGNAPDPQSLLASLREARMPFDLSVTASIGVCDGSVADEAGWKALYRAADRALFDAKAAGRDRMRLAA